MTWWSLRDFVASCIGSIMIVLTVAVAREKR
jgi:hypothetical protein